MSAPSSDESLVAIHQPNYLPWLGYWCKLAVANTFVLYDTCPFSRGSFTARTKFSASRTGYLTVPTRRRPLGTAINSIPVEGQTFALAHRSCISNALYGFAYRDEVIDAFDAGIDLHTPSSQEDLASVNIRLVHAFAQRLGISTKLALASEVAPYRPGLDGICEILSASQATTYLSGSGARSYLPPADELCGGSVRLFYLDGVDAALAIGARREEASASGLTYLARVGFAEASRRLADLKSRVWLEISREAVDGVKRFPDRTR